MSDASQAVAWATWFALGLALCAALAKAGLPTTYVRDLLHVSAGTWVLGWPYWHSPAPPTWIAAAGAAGLAVVPGLAVYSERARRLRNSVTGVDERWNGLVLYGMSFALLTAVGLRGAPFPAAAALLALSLGDGIGGAIGRRFGRHGFQIPGGKRKSLEGSAAVAVFSGCGIWLAAHAFGVGVGPGDVVLASLVAAVAEAIAPRATDNVLLPAAVYGALVFQMRPGP